jgi:hypothetical protein
MTECVYKKTVHTAHGDVVTYRVAKESAPPPAAEQTADTKPTEKPAARKHPVKQMNSTPQTAAKDWPAFSFLKPQPPKKKWHHEPWQTTKKRKPQPPCAHFCQGGAPGLGKH